MIAWLFMRIPRLARRFQSHRLLPQRDRPIVDRLQSRGVIGASQRVVAAHRKRLGQGYFCRVGPCRNVGTITGSVAARGGFGIAGQIGAPGAILSAGELQDGSMITIAQISSSSIGGHRNFRVICIFDFLCGSGLLNGAGVRALEPSDGRCALSGHAGPFSSLVMLDCPEHRSQQRDCGHRMRQQPCRRPPGP